ncbi:MAG: sugar-binding protein [candidate division WOR-3 bacterium]|jgi:ribose transport system substrate-binding protein
MKSFLKVLFPFVAFIVLGLFSGCVREESRYGVLGKSVGPYWDVVKKGAEDAGKELGVKVTVFMPQKEDIPRQIETVETWISMGYKGIAVAPSDPEALVAPINLAMEKGIPTITIDTDSPNSKRICYIGTDNYTAGRVAGEKMAEILGGKGKVAIATGSLTAMNSLERMRGFEDAIKKYSGIEIVEPILCDNEETSRAVELAETALLNNPDLNAFFGVYAFNGPSAAKAVKAAGKKGKVHIVSFDVTDEHLYLIDEGLIDATVAQKQYLMGYEGVKILRSMNKKGIEETLDSLPKNEDGDCIIDTGVDVVTKGNLEEYLKIMDKWGIVHTFNL